MDGYALIDAGDGARLERFGEHVVARPQPGAVGERRAPERWAEADLRFDEDGGWSGTGLTAARTGWTAAIDDLTMTLRPTHTGQIGLFPEHGAMLPWLRDRIAERAPQPHVLNLFGHTGLSTLAMARGGAAVAHVDASRPAVAWARANATHNALDGLPVRWLVDDVRAFVGREIRRGRRYDGVVLDPPTYGHGTSGRAWRLDRDLGRLADDVRRLLLPGGFVLLTTHTAFTHVATLRPHVGARAEVGELALTAESGAVLALGAYARMGGAS